MDYFGLAIVAAAFVAICALIGGPLAWVIGLRGLWAAATAPAFAMTVIAIASVLVGLTGLGWSLLPVVIVAVVIGGAIVLARRLAGQRDVVERASGAGWWTLLVIVLAVAILAWRVTQVIGAPDAISQTFDNVFHLNAIRYILDTGSASPLEIGRMTSSGGPASFYPSLWHATGALLAQLTGVDIPTVVNGETIVIAAVIWPLSALLLARVLAGSSRAVTAAAGAVAVAVPAFPILVMDYGVLYPMQLSFALLPVALAATAAAVGLGGRHDLPPVWWVVIVLGALTGVTLAHPGGFVAWLALSLPMIAFAIWRWWRAVHGSRARWLVVLVTVVYLFVGAGLLLALRPPSPTRQWPTVMTSLDAVWDVLSVNLHYGAPALLAAVAVVLGIVWTIKERTPEAFTVLSMWFIGAVLFVVVSSSPWQILRAVLTGSWYNDWPRLAALFAVALLPLAAFGAGRSLQWSGRRLSARLHFSVAVQTLLAVVGVVVLFAASQLWAMPKAVEQAHGSFAMGPDSPLVSTDEMALMKRVADHVPEGVVVAGNPYTGASLVYAIGGRPTLMPHILLAITDEINEINDGLDEAGDGTAVCDAIDELNVGFVLDFGDREVHGGSHPLPGLDDLENSSAVRLVDSEGDAKLYEIVACGG